MQKLTENVEFPLVEFLVVNEALFVFLILRPMKRGLKYSFLPLLTDIKSWFRAIVALFIFIFIGLPIGVSTKFIAWDPVSDTIINFVLELIGIYFFIAIVEEFLFRSVIQNLIEEIFDALFPRSASTATPGFMPQTPTSPRTPGPKPGQPENFSSTSSNASSIASTFDKEDPRIICIDSFDPAPPPMPSSKRKVIGSDGTVESTERVSKCEKAFASFYRFVYIPRNAIVALIVASVIFGAAHLDNNTTNYHVPNFMYMLMATIAGLLYGWTWRASGNIVFSAITHALVDWIWVTCFSG